MENNEVVDVGFAKEFQESARNSKVMKFAKETLKLKLFEINPDDLVIIKSTINSPKCINSVDIYSEEFISTCL